jgi:hypothetical protein
MTLNIPATIYAEFTYSEPARIMGGSYYPTLSGAYADVQDGDTIQAREYTFSEDLNLTKAAVNFVLSGGYDVSYSANTGYSILAGSLTIYDGSLTVENLVIR